MPVVQTKFTSLPDFLKKIYDQKRDWESGGNEFLNVWFRGQSRASDCLIPGLYRRGFETVDEHEYRNDFKLKSFCYLAGMSAKTDWEEYALMQHYGLPTRLLDWTEGALIALQFALFGRKVSGDVAVWMMDPQWFNQKVHNDNFLCRPDHERAKPYLPAVWKRELPKDPLAMEIPYNSPRISAQRGIFTIHGERTDPIRSIESYATDEGSRCAQFILPERHVLACRRELRTAGISNTLIYPSLEGLCDELWHAYVEEKVLE